MKNERCISFSIFHLPFTIFRVRHGFLLIDKPEGPTSHDVLYQVRKRLGEKKIGHLGTLDPAASGLLLLAVGKKALKVVELFSDMPKEYLAEVTLGAVSSTYDREGVVEDFAIKPGWTEPSQVDVQCIIQDHFIGSIEQVPPLHSAVHVGGERAYRKARRGESVTLDPRNVNIADCSIESYTYPTLTLRVACSSGTYIRSLAHDLGTHLRCGGYLSALRRTKVGEWTVDFAVPPEDAIWADVIPLHEVLAHMRKIELTDDEYGDICHGRTIERTLTQECMAWHDDLPVAIIGPSKRSAEQAHARKVL